MLDVRVAHPRYGPNDHASDNIAVGSVKTLRRLLSGTSDAAIRFDDLCLLLESLDFEKRVKGSHHIFRRMGIEEKIQVKQVRALVLKYKLGELA